MQRLYAHNCVNPRRTQGFIGPSVTSALQGLITGSSLMAGAFIAKRFVLKLDPNVFRLVMDGIMLVAGVAMVWNAFAGAS